MHNGELNKVREGERFQRGIQSRGDKEKGGREKKRKLLFPQVRG